MVKISPLTAGFITGIWIAVAEALVRILPPDVHGICLIGHPNDLWNWVLNHVFRTNFFVHPVSIVIPVLTVLGVPIGATIAAMQHKELKLRPRREFIDYFVLGFIAVNFGLILGACPLKTTGLVAFGNLLSLIGLIAIFVGVVLGCKYMKWRVTRRTY